MTYPSEPTTAAQIHAGEPFDECPSCGKDRCACTPRQRLDALIEADVAWAFAQTSASLAKYAPRDTTPLAGGSR